MNPVSILGRDLGDSSGRQALQDALDTLYGLIVKASGRSGAGATTFDELRVRKLTITETVDVVPQDKPPANAFANLVTPWLTAQRGRPLTMRYEDQNDGGDLLEWRFQPYTLGTPTSTTGDWELRAYTAQRDTAGAYRSAGALVLSEDGRLRLMDASETAIFDTDSLNSSAGFGGSGADGSATLSTDGYVVPGTNYEDLTISAVRTVEMNATSQLVPPMVLSVHGNLTIASGGDLNMDGRGYYSGHGGAGAAGGASSAATSAGGTGVNPASVEFVTASGGGGSGGSGTNSGIGGSASGAGASGANRSNYAEVTFAGSGAGVGGVAVGAGTAVGLVGGALTAATAGTSDQLTALGKARWGLFGFGGASGGGGGGGSGGRTTAAGTSGAGGSFSNNSVLPNAADRGHGSTAGFGQSVTTGAGGGGGGAAGGRGGGLIYIEVLGNVTVASGGRIGSTGGNGGTGGAGGAATGGVGHVPGGGGGGGSAGSGGLIVIRYGGTYTNSGTVVAAAGSGGAGGAGGGGGALGGGAGAAGEAGYVLLYKEAP